MNRGFISVIIGVVFVIQTTVVCAAQLSTSLAQYTAGTQALVAVEKNEKVQKYLLTCLSSAQSLNGLEAGDPRVPPAFKELVAGRLAAGGDLDAETSGSVGVRTEVNSYNVHLQPYAKTNYLNLIALQDQLLERKYFKAETAKNANFLEGYVNSKWHLTRVEHFNVQEVLNDPHLGVSPWEAIFRLEPTMAVEHGAQIAFLGTAGLSYAFFPDIDRKADPYLFREDFWSKWVQKSGVRLGLGAGNLDNHVKLLVGAGVQLNALGLWGLYKPDGGTFLFGLSASDLSKFKKVISWMQ